MPARRIVHLDIAPSGAIERVSTRLGHLFPASLVASQFEALEAPLGEAGVLPVRVAQPLAAQVDTVLRWLAQDMRA